ncbi:hypothetical protein KUL25_07025 [Rhodobacteraceae bacterium N5(2021)]|uniref:Chitin binding peritrophin-A-like protein n=1 Tax=Gymnodinialimonas phycosphaerae TaxID=2841589 RepID=A0A975YI71_9RHOB|nr:hypothetical protein [Gymnodinialimonas phycosphaerae]MBY4892513.1 hypothetical protein [Gymnodinialimonas phycosphaerae]
MTIKTLLAASVLLVVPAIAQAQCSWGASSTEAQISCAGGMTWDAEAMACVATASS